MKNNFLNQQTGVFEVRGAAGAGKTNQLAEDVQALVNEDRRGIVISFSNAAVDELKSRVSGNKVTIKTIHSMCWFLIKGVINTLVTDEEIHDELIGYLVECKAITKTVPNQTISTVLYSDTNPVTKLTNGKLTLSHDALLRVFEICLKKSSEFQSHLASTLAFILIDEFQDTSFRLVKCLIDRLGKMLLLGFYGDPFQTVYLKTRKDQLSDNLDYTWFENHIGTCQLRLSENYRSGDKLVTFFNRIRKPFDGLIQSPVHVGGDFNVFVGDGELNSTRRAVIQRSMSMHDPKILTSIHILRTELIREGDSKSAWELRHWIQQIRSSGFTPPFSEIYKAEKECREIQVLRLMDQFGFGTGYQRAQSPLQLFTSGSLRAANIDQVKQTAAKFARSTVYTRTDFESCGLELNEIVKSVFSQGSNGSIPMNPSDIHAFFCDVDSARTISDTIPGTKGCEFDEVILDIDYQGNQPRYLLWDNINFNFKIGDKFDECQKLDYLFYVGITRARLKLAIYINQRQYPLFLQKLKQVSPNLVAIQL